MPVARGWSGLVAGLGVMASTGMVSRFSSLVHAVEYGEVAVLKAIPVAAGVALLLVASLRLLARGATRGKGFAVACGLLAISQFRMPTVDFSFWLWLALAIALAGAITGFRTVAVRKSEA